MTHDTTSLATLGGASAHEVLPDLAYLRDAIVNLYFIGERGARRWVLVDAGATGAVSRIARLAEDRYGPAARPAAIVLTHGHFDHVAALRELAERWDVPIYAHPLELPYLDGRSPYPPPDPWVGGGAMALLSPLFPRGPFDFSEWLRPLPDDGSIDELPGWRWVHTPGHSPGHVALFREADRTLIAGDAFVTTKQESAVAVLMQRREMHGPPAYFTPDWSAAHRSVAALAELEPEIAATGHGRPWAGEQMRASLRTLANDFSRLAVPQHGRYLRQPALTDAAGIVDVPPAVGPSLRTVAGAVATALGVLVTVRAVRRSSHSRG